MMRTIGVIPARYASTRFPGKPLELIAGKALIQRVYEGASLSKSLDKLIVATDDQRIFNFVESFGGDVVMTSNDLQTGSDRVWQAVEAMDADIVINIQGDEPLISPSWLDNIVAPFKKQGEAPEMVTLAKPILSSELKDKNVVKLIKNKNNNAIYFSRFPIPFSRFEGSLSGCFKHIGLYAYQKKFLKKFCAQEPTSLEKAESLEQLRALYLGAKIRVIEVDEDAIGVDHPSDIKKVEDILMKKGLA